MELVNGVAAADGDTSGGSEIVDCSEGNLDAGFLGDREGSRPADDLSGDEETELAAVDEEAFDDVDENDNVELPDADREDWPEAGESVNENVEEP